MDNTRRKNLKSQSIIFGIQILFLDSKKIWELKYHFLDDISL